MKTTVSAFFILLLLIFFTYYVSHKQEDALVPIYYKLENSERLSHKEREKVLRECLKLLKESSFIIKLGIPSGDYDKLQLLFEKAIIYINEDDTGYSFAEKECKLQLKSVLEHCDITLNNIL